MHGKSLFEVYKNPSAEKVVIWSKILDDYLKCNGYNIDVCGNSFTFSVTYNYRDEFNHEHVVYITRDNEIDRIVWTEKDIIAVNSDSAFSGYCILHIDDYAEKAISCYYYDGKISDIKRTKIHHSILGRAYIIRNKRKLYLDDFLKV